MIGYIYLTTNLINNKKYIGKRQSPYFDETYKGSGVLLHKAIDKYGWDNFSCEIIKECFSIEELNKEEKYLIEKYDAVNNNMYYNIASGGTGGNTGRQYKGMPPHKKEHSEETKIKMSISHKGHTTSKETRIKISKSNKGKKRTLDQIEANRDRNTNKVWIRKDNIQKTIKKDELSIYLENGWEKGRLKNSKPAWNKGLTKESNDSLKKLSEKRKEALKHHPIGCFSLKGEYNKNSKENRK